MNKNNTKVVLRLGNQLDARVVADPCGQARHRPGVTLMERTIGQILLFSTSLAVVTISMPACSTSPNRGIRDESSQSTPKVAGERKADEIIADRVRVALAAATDVYAGHIDVDCNGGAVRLSGFAYSVEESQSATRITMPVDGVRRVSNDLEIQAPELRPNR